VPCWRRRLNGEAASIGDRDRASAVSRDEFCDLIETV